MKYDHFDLVEGIHYYREGNRVIFTERFHELRGSCCGAGCKHCPYDPKAERGNKKLKEKGSS